MYYVYEWFIVATDEVIYVGKGTRSRYRVKKHNKLFNEMLKRFECESRIIKEFETEREAFDFEFERVNELRSIGQCVCNLRNGGFGGSTEWWTDEIRKRYSDYNVMKSDRQRERMSSQNPMKNPSIAKKTNSQKRRAVIIGDREFESVKAAAETLNTCNESIRLWCLKGIDAKGQKCRYKDSPQVEFTGKRFNKGGCRPLTYKGKHYETPKDLAVEIGLSGDAVSIWARRGYDPKGEPCRYDDKDYDT